MPPRRSKARAPDPFVELEKNGPRPVYVLDGDERALLEDFLAALKDAAVPPASRDFNFEAFVGRETTVARVLDSASTLPAFAQRRMVVVTQADKLFAESAPLIAYLAEPSPTTVLVFVGEQFDGRTKVYQAAKKSGAAIRFSRPQPREMPAIVRARAQRRGLKIEPDAVRMVVDAVGADIGAVDHSLELLDLYRGEEDRPIDADDVATVIFAVKEESVFELVDAIGGGDRETALALLYRILVVQREPALRVLALVARHYRQLLTVRDLSERRTPPPDIARVLGVPPFVVDKLGPQARRMSIEGLVKGHALIKAADRQLKGGKLSDARVMEGLALGLMQCTG
jgi:DNA polymerase-3 subunit delta